MQRQVLNILNIQKNQSLCDNGGVSQGYSSNPDGSKESACNAGDTGWSLGQEDPLKKEMATHFSILAWEIQWTEEPGVTKVRCDLVTKPPPPSE